MTRRLTSQGQEQTKGGNFMPNAPAARVFGGTALGAGGFQVQAMGSESADNDNMHDPVTNNSRVTINTSGRYLVIGEIFFAAAGGGAFRGCIIYKNGSSAGTKDQIIPHNGSAVQQVHVQAMDVLDLVKGDYIELAAYADVAVGVNEADLMVTWVGPFMLNAVRDKPTVSYVTPAQFAALTPVDGDEVYLIVDATAGVTWHLRYNAGSSSAYKWEFLGGPPAYAQVLSAETATGTDVDLSTVGPSITVPRNGDYDVDYGAVLSNANAGGTAQVYVYFNGGSNHGDGGVASSGGSVAPSGAKGRTITSVTAGVVKLVYWSSGGFVSTFQNRWMKIRPIRIS